MLQDRPDLFTSILINHSIVIFVTAASHLYLLEQPPLS